MTPKGTAVSGYHRADGSRDQASAAHSRTDPRRPGSVRGALRRVEGAALRGIPRGRAVRERRASRLVEVVPRLEAGAAASPLNRVQLPGRRPGRVRALPSRLGRVLRFGRRPPNGPSFDDVTDPATGEILGVDVEEFHLRFPTGTSLSVNVFITAQAELHRRSRGTRSTSRHGNGCCGDSAATTTTRAKMGRSSICTKADGEREAQPGPVSFQQIYEMVTLENAARSSE
jgi:hypothetical protein